MKAIAAFSNAVQLDPQLSQSYAYRAEEYRQLKKYSLAIADFDKVLVLDKNNASAYADRGVTYLDAGHYLNAILDLGEAIKRQPEDSPARSRWYEYRAEANSKLGIYRAAIDDYSGAIRCHLAILIHSVGLNQFRGLYPEYDNVANEVLIRKLNVLFRPEYDYAKISKMLLENKSEQMGGMIDELYEKRGDSYLRSGEYRRGLLDFNRIFKGIRASAHRRIERWRLMGGKVGEEWYIDAKNTEFAGTPRLWTKFVQKDGSYTVQLFDFDCRSRRIAIISTALYDKDDELRNSSEVSGGWQAVVPESRGEQVFEGMCKVPY